MKCIFCGLDPCERIDGMPVAINCCEAGYMYYEQSKGEQEIRNTMNSIAFLYDMQPSRRTINDHQIPF